MFSYRIIVSGGLGEAGREAFRDFHIETYGRDTVLTGDLDQPGLLGALARARPGLALQGPAGRARMAYLRRCAKAVFREVERLSI
jgi:hypothetical protein